MSSGGGDGTVCSCVTPCLDDADCADTEVCVCAAAIEQDLSVRAVAYYPSCQRAECHGEVDFPAECRGETSGSCGLGVGVTACDGAADTCANDADCAGLANGRCDYSYADEAWSCVEGSTCT